MDNQTRKPVNAVSIILFNIGYTISVFFWGLFSFLVWPFFPLEKRFFLVLHSWASFMLWWIKVTCHIRCEVQGLENIPKEPVVVMSNHQSSLETFYLQTLFTPLSTVIKRELLYIPFFGWGFAALNPIAINRSKRNEAMKQLTSIGQKRLRQKMSVLIFPEGTRVHIKRRDQRFSRGGAVLAINSGAQVVPVVHNSGLYWPAHQFRKYQGTVTFVIGKPIDSKGLSSEELTLQVKQWILSQLQQLQ